MTLEIDEPIENQLGKLFAYKAEWLRGRLFELFTEPTYLPELTRPQPCVLIGGRGTGKTTVLKGMSYEGQFALRRGEPVEKWPYYGLYYRVNTNRVTAFQGPELSESQWARLFAHYVNIVLCDLVLNFLDWYRLRSPLSADINEAACRRVAASLHLEDAGNVRDLGSALETARVRFEAYINNVADHDFVPISMQAAPVDELLASILRLEHFQEKRIFFLLDEYENLLDYQQQVINTLIKHSDLYTFKIGVRELGWRVRTTLNVNEQLISPADYDRVNISEKFEGEAFKEFARSVCNTRITRLKTPSDDVIRDVNEFMPGLSEEEEARLLGASEIATAVKDELKINVAPHDFSRVEELDLLEASLLKFWARAQGTTVQDEFQWSINNPREWKDRCNNYKHSVLYTLRRGKRGIQKFYSGWDVFTQLAGNNIRYLLELVDQSLSVHLRAGGRLSEPLSQKIQTEAAQRVGKKNLSELEGLSVYGAQLTRLLLGLGRVFGIMAQDAVGHAPEVNQFHLVDEELGEEAESLLKAAVMHLALVRFPGNKLADDTDTKAYDYMVHPIFSAFFVFSYRQKRKMSLSGSEVIGMIKSPKKTIRSILSRSDRTIEESLPEQLFLFEKYYNADS